MPIGSPPLDYATTGKRSRRRWILRGILLAALIGAGIEGYWNRGYVDHLRLLYAQHQCMVYTAPAGQIVYDEDPATMAAMKSVRNYIIAPQEMSPNTSLVYMPDCWPPIKATGWQFYMKENFSHESGWTTAAVAFLHSRVSRGGHERLVAVELLPGLDPTFGANAIRPAGLFAGPPTTSSGSWIRVCRYPEKKRFRVWAGVPDMSDSSHFTINYELDNDRGTIDGWLLDDDRVVLKPRLGWTYANGGPDDLFWSPKNYANRLVTLQPTAQLQFLDPSDGKPEQCLHLAYSADGRYLAVVTYEHIYVRNLRTGQMQSIAIPNTLYEATHLALSADGSRVATVHRGGYIRVWQTRDGRAIASHHIPNGDFVGVAFSPGGSRLFAVTRPANAANSPDAAVEWDASNGKTIKTFEPANSGDFVTCMALSPDGRTLYAGGFVGLLLSWDLQTGRITRRSVAGIGLDFSGDGKFLLAVENGNNHGNAGCVLVDTETGKTVLTRYIPNGGVDTLGDFDTLGNHVAISPSGKAFACSADLFPSSQPTDTAGVCLWDLPTANTLWELSLPTGQRAGELVFSPDGRTLAVNIGKTILLCDVDPSLAKP